MIFDSQDETLVQGLKSLRELVSPETSIIIGGRAAWWYEERVENIGIEFLPDIRALRSRLQELL
jgi:hypothetical protein